jgi:hypothetical protein
MLVLILAGIAAVVVYAMIKLGDSKATGKVVSRSPGHDEAWALYREGLERRQDESQSEAPAVDGEATADSGDAPSADGNRLTTALVEITTSFVSTGTPITETFTTTTVSVVETDVVTTITSTIPGFITTIFPTEDETDPTQTGEDQGPVESSVAASTVVSIQTLTGSQSVTMDVVMTTTKPGDKFVKYGQTTISSTFTVDRQGRKVEGGPVTNIITQEVQGTVLTSVEQVQPTTFESIGLDGLPTIVTATLPPITHISSVPPTRTIITSTSAPTAPGDMIIVESTVYKMTPGEYFIGKFLPPLVAVIIALAIRAVDLSAKLYQPFAALSHPLGATGRDSLTLHFEGWKGFWRPFGMLAEGHPVPLLSTLAVWLSNCLAPVATEAIVLNLQGRCKVDAILGCALTLGVSRSGAYALLGLLAVIAILLILLLITISSRWKTGVFADPWCIAGAAALTRNPDIRVLASLDRYSAVKTALAEKRFCLGWFRHNDHDEQEEYGLVLCDEAGRSLRGSRRDEVSADMLRDAASSADQDAATGGIYGDGDGMTPRARKPPATFTALTFWWRLVFLVYMLALAGFIMYYHLGIKVPKSLEDFLQAEKFGVRFVSSGLGMIVVLCWECVFDSKYKHP